MLETNPNATHRQGRENGETKTNQPNQRNQRNQPNQPQLMEDRQLERKGADWLEYKKAVPSSLVPIPPFISRKLSGTSVAKQHETGGVKVSS